jgi:hypothetical protein
LQRRNVLTQLSVPASSPLGSRRLGGQTPRRVGRQPTGGASSSTTPAPQPRSINVPLGRFGPEGEWANLLAPHAATFMGLERLWGEKYGHLSRPELLMALGVDPTAPGVGNPATWLAQMYEEELPFWGSPDEAVQALLDRADVALQMFGPPAPEPVAEAGLVEPAGGGEFYGNVRLPVQNPASPTDWWQWLFGGGLGLGSAEGGTTAAAPSLALNPQYLLYR